jgi:hypothetical protein
MTCTTAPGTTSASAISPVFRRQVEQIHYEAWRAFEQYDEVDARDRLVAAESVRCARPSRGVASPLPIRRSRPNQSTS